MNNNTIKRRGNDRSLLQQSKSLVSWGDGCGGSPPGVYARVSAAANSFISQGICELSSVPPSWCNTGGLPSAPPPTAVPPPAPTVPTAPVPTAPVPTPTLPPTRVRCESCAGMLGLTGELVHGTSLFSGGACVERCAVLFAFFFLATGYKCGPCPDS
jgi:hypothetical protein